MSEIAGKFYGKYRATVVNNIDPLLLGRIQVMVPAISAHFGGPCYFGSRLLDIAQPVKRDAEPETHFGWGIGPLYLAREVIACRAEILALHCSQTELVIVQLPKRGPVGSGLQTDSQAQK